MADTTSTTATKRDQPADTKTDESSAKKQKVEETQAEAPKMSALRLGSVAPDFEAKTTQGPIKFHDFIDGSWAILFSCVACLLSRLVLFRLFPLATGFYDGRSLISYGPLASGELSRSERPLCLSLGVLTYLSSFTSPSVSAVTRPTSKLHSHVKQFL